MAHPCVFSCSSSLLRKLPLLVLLGCSLFVISVSGLAAPPVALPVIRYDEGVYLVSPAKVAAATVHAQVAGISGSLASPIVRKGQLPTKRLGPKPRVFTTKPTAKLDIHTAAAAVTTSSTPGSEFYLYRFPGISQLAQEEAATVSSGGLYQGNQSVQEPANVGLAAGGGYTIQVVSNAIFVTDQFGKYLSAVTELNQFFNLQSGDLLVDPRVLYDAGNGRFYVTVAGINNDNVFPSRFPELQSYQLIAVSKGLNPMAGFYYYYYETMLPANYHAPYGSDLCPCYASFQSLGFTGDSLLISANALSMADDSFAGALIQAISKAALAQGKTTAGGVRFDGDPSFDGYLTLSGASFDDYGDINGRAFSVQPAHVPPIFRGGSPGAAYFLCTDVLNSTLSGSTVELFALTKTSSLSSNPTQVKLSQVSIPLAGYTWPPAGIQKTGSAPLAKNLNATLEQIDTGDDRMHQVVLANGLLFGAFTTGTSDVSGIFYVIIRPSVDAAGQVSGELVSSGIISVTGAYLAYPAITANRNEALVMYTVTSPSIYPSLAFSSINLTTFAVSKSSVVFKGTEPIDGISGYRNAGYPVPPTGPGQPQPPPPSQPISYFGAYSAAVGDGDGSFWVSGETAISGPRDHYANWGTMIARVRL